MIEPQLTERQELDVTGINLIKLVQEVYKHSEPLGLGYNDYIEGHELPKKEAKHYISSTSDSRFVINLDYIRGRACKFGIFKKRVPFLEIFARERWVCIENTWRDHSFDEVKELIERVRSG